MHDQPEVDSTDNRKTQVILDYNKTKAGVDTMDQVTHCYSTKRMIRRWPMVIFFNMLDISALNAFIIYMSLNPDSQKSINTDCNVDF